MSSADKDIELRTTGGAGVLVAPPTSPTGDDKAPAPTPTADPDEEAWIEAQWQEHQKLWEYRRRHPCWSRVTSKEWMCRPMVLIPLAVTVIVVGLALAEFAIWTSGTDVYLPVAEPCPALPSTSSYTIKKEVFSQWHWTYAFDGFDGTLVKMCPSLQDDAAVYIGDDLVARTDAKVFSFTNKAYVLDCHGQRIFIIETGSLWSATINSVSVFVSLEVQSANGTLLGYVSDDNFWSDDIEVKDAGTGALVATVKRQTLSLSAWEWDINVVNAAAPAADARVLALLAGLRSFEGNDGCNKFFFTTGKVLAVVAGLMLLCVLAGLCLLKKMCEDGARKRKRMAAAGIMAPTREQLEQARLAEVEKQRLAFSEMIRPLARSQVKRTRGASGGNPGGLGSTQI